DAETRFCARCGKELPAASAGQSTVPPPPPAAPPTVHAATPAAPPTVHAEMPAAPPTVHAAMPAAPAYAPSPPGPGAPAGSSPATLFLRRTFTGRWDLPAAAGVVPAL